MQHTVATRGQAHERAAGELASTARLPCYREVPLQVARCHKRLSHRLTSFAVSQSFSLARHLVNVQSLNCTTLWVLVPQHELLWRQEVGNDQGVPGIALVVAAHCRHRHSWRVLFLVFQERHDHEAKEAGRCV